MAIKQIYIDEARNEILSQPYGNRIKKAQTWAERLGISRGHLFRLIRPKEEKRKRKGTPKHPEYLEYARIVFQVKKRPPREKGEISTEDALALAIKQELLPSDAANIPIGTFNAIARKQGWTKTERQVVRFQADKPNEMHHFDASTSDILYVAKELPGGDYLLKINPNPCSGGYKNKPIPVNKLRPWIYGLVDDHSGRMISRYVAARGEEAGDSMDFLCYAWSQIGLPEKLFSDQGMLQKSKAAGNWLSRLGVEVLESMPYAKEAHGKIERPWRTHWQKYEKPFYAALSDWKKFKITLSELNRQHAIYIEDKYNEMPHRWEKSITKMQKWSRIALNGGIVKIPENILRIIAQENERTVTTEGIVWLENIAYEVVGLYSAKVKVLREFFGDRIVAVDVKTGLKYPMREFRPLSLGEFRSHAATPHQQLVKQSETLALSGITLYSEKKPQDERILSMPIRTKEEREIEDPFALPDRYTNVNEAMKDFMSYLPGVFLKPDEREVIEKEIEAHGLSKAFVENFGLEVRAQMAIRQAM